MYSVAPGLKGSIWLFGFAALFGSFGGLVLIEQCRFEHSALRTQGHVVEHQSRTALDKHKHPYLQLIDVYELTPEAGATVHFEQVLHGAEAHTPIGQSADVYYLSSAPEHARLDGENTSLGWTLLGIGAMMGAAALVNLRRPPAPRQPNALKNREKTARRKHRSRRKQRSAR